MLITPDALGVLYFTATSCGHDWAKDLNGAKEPLSIEALSKMQPNSELFPNLLNLAQQNNLTELTEDCLIRYFGTEHLFDANRTVNFQLGQSPEIVGQMLANCILWPLDQDLSYRGPRGKIVLKGFVSLGGKGTAFAHRGAIFRLPARPQTVFGIKEWQETNKLFQEALSTIGDELTLPFNQKATA
jgi:hypothetical protein